MFKKNSKLQLFFCQTLQQNNQNTNKYLRFVYRYYPRILFLYLRIISLTNFFIKISNQFKQYTCFFLTKYRSSVNIPNHPPPSGSLFQRLLWVITRLIRRILSTAGNIGASFPHHGLAGRTGATAPYTKPPASLVVRPTLINKKNLLR